MRKKARVFWLHFNRLGMKRGSPDIWTIHTSKGCIHCKHVDVQVPLQSIYKGDTAPQPRAYFKGKGVVDNLGHGRFRIREER